MPYSITTKDGITIDGIADNVPSDAPQLKSRVAQLRAERDGAQQEPAAASPKPHPDAVEPPNFIERQLAKLPNILSPKAESMVRGIAMGAADPSVGAAQLLAHGAEAVTPDYLLPKQNLSSLVTGEGPPRLSTMIDKGIAAKEKEYEAGRAGAGREGFDAARLAGNVISPANLGPGKVFDALKGTSTIPQLIKAGAASAAVSGAMQPVTDTEDGYAGKKAGQVISSAAGGAVLTPALSKAASAVARGIQSAGNVARPSAQVATTNIFSSQGINPADVPDAVTASVGRQVQEALDSKLKIDPATIIRKAQFEAVGLTDDAAPTLGQVTRDPMQFAKEKNLSGIDLNGENKLATQFQNQQQRVGKLFDDMGAAGATDRNTAGQTLIQALRGADEPAKAGVDKLYGAARDQSMGRMADLDRAAFTTAASDALDEGMMGSFVPPNVRSLLNNISEGKGPFNVDSAVQIDTLLSKAQRQAQNGSDDAGAMAIGKIRDALHNTPLVEAAQTVATSAAPEAIAAVVDEGKLARDAFTQARQAARSRFATIEQTPALKAALDDVAPDRFVQKFVLGADARDVAAMKTILQNSPEALDQARAQVADHLKRAAFGENPSGDKAFSADRYLKTLTALGKQKLELFFKPEEVVQLNLAGKVMSDISSEPAGSKYAIGRAGTAQAAINMITGILGKLPGGGVLGVPLNFIKNEVGNYKTQQAIDSALTAAPAKEVQQLSPEILRLIDAAGATGAVGSGVFGGSGFR